MAVEFNGPLEGPFRWSIEAPVERPVDGFGEWLDALGKAAAGLDGGVQLWIPEVDESEDMVDDRLASTRGFEPYRDLWQLRCDLPLDSTDLVTRGYVDGDADAVIAINNRAFSWHPEQGGMTLDGLHSRQAEPWFEPEGLLIHERDGRVVGFNWTKEHRDADPHMGEIYVIAIDPDYHGLGLGRGLTLAGMAHLHGRGFDIGMLYVESDNDAANRTYERVGFTRHHTNRAYALKR